MCTAVEGGFRSQLTSPGGSTEGGEAEEWWWLLYRGFAEVIRTEEPKWNYHVIKR